jgi:hypothetical protein
MHHHVFAGNPVAGEGPMGFLKKKYIDCLILQPHHQKIPVCRGESIAVP